MANVTLQLDGTRWTLTPRLGSIRVRTDVALWTTGDVGLEIAFFAFGWWLRDPGDAVTTGLRVRVRRHVDVAGQAMANVAEFEWMAFGEW